MADYNEALSEISGYPKALSHAGSGGGSFKTVTMTNNAVAMNLSNVVFEGKYYSLQGDGFPLDLGETKTFEYVQPADEDGWMITPSFKVEPTEEVEGVFFEEDGSAFAILDTAEDGVHITLEKIGGVDPI